MTNTKGMWEISDNAVLCKKPVVSVCMVTYKHEQFIADAINGVIRQKCEFPIELVIADDCSPDRTPVIVREYQKRYPALIRVIGSSHNVGAYRNEFRCVQACRGDFVAMCEGDDFWSDTTKLARQVDVFRKYKKCTLVFHASKYIDATTGDTCGSSRQSLFSRVVSTEEVILGDGGFIPTASIMVRGSIGRNRPTWSHESPVGDYPLALQAAAMGLVIYLDRFMAVYRTDVPHSWSKRHVPDVSKRIYHACGIENMLCAFDAETEWRFSAAVEEMVSKYYSDPIVRLRGQCRTKSELYLTFRNKLRGSDRLLAWLAVTCGLRLPWLKDLLRKSGSLTRLVKAHILSERIRKK